MVVIGKAYSRTRTMLKALGGFVLLVAGFALLSFGTHSKTTKFAQMSEIIGVAHADVPDGGDGGGGDTVAGDGDGDGGGGDAGDGCGDGSGCGDSAGGGSDSGGSGDSGSSGGADSGACGDGDCG